MTINDLIERLEECDDKDSPIVSYYNGDFLPATIIVRNVSDTKQGWLGVDLYAEVEEECK